MKNIEIALRSDYVNNTGDCFKMIFNFDDEEETRITTVNAKDNTQHDFALTKGDYLFIREQLDKHFKDESVRFNGLPLQTHPNT